MADVMVLPNKPLLPKSPSGRSGKGENIVDELMKASKASLFQTARGIVEGKVGDSKVFDSTVEDRVPRFNKDELRLGRILGRGGFCVAIEIDKVKIAGLKREGSSVGSNAFFSLFRKTSHHTQHDDDASGSDPERASECPRHGLDASQKHSAYSVMDYTRTNVAMLAKKRSRKGGRFVLKQVLSDSLDNYAYLKGLVDLGMEAKFLAALDHPNIIALCGMSSKGPAHFIIVERLSETLSSRFKTWMKIDRQCKGITGAFTGSKRKETELYETRIGVAYNMACAMAYLHEKNIIFRDLKPDNCGFDLQDQFKLFDFGLAKELKECDKVDDRLYKLTGMTGAMRYMAPEVGLSKPYGLSADVYSWAMVMWFILALEPPFGFYTEDMIQDRVFKRGSRPAIFSSWSELLGGTMKLAWGTDASLRPTFTHISAVLRMELGGTAADSTNNTSLASSNGLLFE